MLMWIAWRWEKSVPAGSGGRRLPGGGDTWAVHAEVSVWGSVVLVLGVTVCEVKKEAADKEILMLAGADSWGVLRPALRGGKSGCSLAGSVTGLWSRCQLRMGLISRLLWQRILFQTHSSGCWRHFIFISVPSYEFSESCAILYTSSVPRRKVVIGDFTHLLKNSFLLKRKLGKLFSKADHCMTYPVFLVVGITVLSLGT